MAQVKQVTAEGLHWVKDELGSSLERVRGFVEAYLEAPANPLPLQRSVVELHQIRGTLRMVQCDGVALLAEEMKATVADLLADVDNAPEKAFEALLGATLQLADYLDLLSTGEADNALVFLPLINELRVARGAGVVSESVLFTRYAQLQAPQPPEIDLDGREPNAGQAIARQRLSAFQAALLRVLKDQDAPTNLDRLAGIADEMADGVSEARGVRLFVAVKALIEALRDGGVEPELEVKRLLGRVGQQLKTVAESGDAALADVPDELLWGLIYFVGRSDSDGPEVGALRQDYDLASLLSTPAELERQRARLRGPNTGLVHKLSDAIKQDIETVKDNIDLVIRAGDKAEVSIEDTVASTERIGDTLAMLGLDMLKRVVLNQSQAIESLAREGVREQSAWMDVAMALLRVEQSLDNALFQHMYGGSEPAPEELPLPHQDIDAGAAAIYREALVNLSRVKTLIPDYIDDGETGLLAEAARLLREVEAGLLMLDREEAVALLARLRSFITSRAMQGARNNPPLILLLADAVASIEYYLEALQAAQQRPESLLERAQSYIDQLEVPVGDDQPLVAETEAVAEQASEAADTPDEVDPEIRDVFLEEAGEVLATLQRDVPAWSNNVDDSERLAEIRRAFHTLKGSGRMVGASDIGEFGWAVENMLNRCLEGAIEITAGVVEVVDKAVTLLPALIEDFQAGRQPQDLAGVIRMAYAAAGQPMSDEADTGSEDKTAHPDSELFRIFRGDAGKRIEVLREFVAGDMPRAVDDGLVRALHTLKGSAEAVHAQQIARLAGALEQYANASRAARWPIDAEAAALLGDACRAFESRLEALDRDSEAGVDEVDALLARIESLHADLPQEAVEASSDRELLVVFTDEACDLVDGLDSGLTDWRKNPADDHYPRQLKSICHTLKGSAHTAEADVIGEVAQGLESHFADTIGDGRTPTEGDFEALQEVVDGLYDLLDRFRHGERSGDARALLAPLGETPEQDGAAAWSAAESYSIDMPPAPEWPPEETREPPSGDEPEPVAAVTDGSQAARDDAGADEADDGGVDPELVDIFLGEATELLENLDTQLDAWERDPDDERPRLELMRVLHTLKGSARMARLSAIGDVSHELESLVGGAATPAARRSESLIAALRNTADGIHRLLDQVQRGESDIHAETLLADLDELPQTAEASGEEVAADEAPDSGASDSEIADAAEVPAPPPDVFEPETAAGSEAASEAESAGGPEAETAAASQATEFSPRLFWHGEDTTEESAGQLETARVAVEALDDMLNEAGEISIFRARLEQQNTGLQFQLREMAQTTGRLREQLRKLDMETETQILARHDAAGDRYQEEFDPLEMDRYSTLHELSRGLAESVTDLSSLYDSMWQLAEQGEALLVQQGRVNTSLQQGLMRTLMVPFSRQVQRLQRILRQTSQEYGRRARIEFSGIQAELDRNVLERMVAPLEHLLRNAVIHGIEAPEQRSAAGKDETGLVRVRLFREGTQLVIEVRDDGRGLDFSAIRNKAVERGLLPQEARIDEIDLAPFIFEPGFSTAEELTQAAGRGVGMDVVNAEIKQLGGSLNVDSTAGEGTRFTIRLPLTLAISQALLVRLGDEHYAVPLGSIEGVTRVPRAQLADHLESESPSFEYGGQRYRVRGLGELLGGATEADDEDGPRNMPVLLARSGDRRTAFVVDGMLGSREVVVKSIGPQVATVAGISGATVMADGEVVLILDVPALMQMQARRALGTASPAQRAAEISDDRPLVMVVDDSITIRRVAERFLSRHGFRVITAKDGMDALAKLQSHPPDAVLLDIEMPRIDGFELATYMRNNETLRSTPIIMITSRSGDKHRRRAEQIGVERFMTKPYQEQDLLAQLHAVMRREPAATQH